MAKGELKSAIVGKAVKAEEKPEDTEDEGIGLESACSDIIQAVADKDPKALAAALRDAVELCRE